MNKASLDHPSPEMVERLRQDKTAADAAVVEHPVNAEAAIQHPIPMELREHPRYRVLRLLGSGGMGTVYQAEHRLMERTVALKVISRELTTHPTAVERFRREVKAAAKLHHPNIITAHDAEQAGDLHFLVMEFVEGVSLARLVEKRGPLPVSHACQFVRQAALGLQHAFEKGMVHRDIKPQNMMVTRQGRLKILDFGLARLAREHAEAKSVPILGADLSQPGLTAAGTVVGTPDYIAPEQAHDSSRADIRSDIYGLGCTLYFLLTGRPPFPEGTALEKMLAHADTPPTPLTSLRPQVPHEVVAVVERMMAKNPAHRYATPAEVAQALAALGKVSEVVDLPTLPDEPRSAAPSSETISSPKAPARKGRRRPRGKAIARRPLLFALFGVLAGVLTLATGVAWKALKGATGEPGRQTASGDLERTSTPSPWKVVKLLYVLPFDSVWYGDFGPVRDALKAKGVQVEVASWRRGECALHPSDPYRGKAPPIPVDVVLDDALDPTAYDALAFGGYNVAPFCQPGMPCYDVIRRLIDAMMKQRKPVGGICVGQMVLVAAGKRSGKEACANANVQAVALKKNVTDVTWRKVSVIEDKEDRVILAGASEDAEPFAAALLRMLGR